MIMKISPRNLLSVSFLSMSTLLSCLLAVSALAAPIEFSEVSLLVRSHEREPSIAREVAGRKLTRPLTPQQENTLKKQGASDSLVQTLQTPANVMNAGDASAYEARRDQYRKGPTTASASSLSGTAAGAPEGLHIFEVAPGHPVNLSQWGGPDYDLVFNPPTRLDEGGDDAFLVDPIRTGTDVATYHGKGRAADSTTIFPYRDYVSSTSYSFTRGLRIDHKHPVSVKGSPYLLYPVYAAGGVSLYYIGASSESVKFAVSTLAFR